MPHDNEEAELRLLAATVYDALNARDLDAFLTHLTDDVEFTSLVAEAEGATFRGRDGVMVWWNTVMASFGDVHWDVLEMIPGPDGRAVMHLRISGTIADVPVEQTMWQATRVREGKASWWAFFRTREEAFEAAGLGDH